LGLYDSLGAAAYNKQNLIGFTNAGIDGTQKEYSFNLKQLSVNSARAAKKAREFGTSMKELSEALAEGKDGTEEYYKALSKIKTGLANLMNTSTEVIDKLLKSGKISNTDLINLTKGNEKAFNKIVENMQEAMIQELAKVPGNKEQLVRRVQAALAD
jgi:ribonuclease PH